MTPKAGETKAQDKRKRPFKILNMKTNKHQLLYRVAILLTDARRESENLRSLANTIYMTGNLPTHRRTSGQILIRVHKLHEEL